MALFGGGRAPKYLRLGTTPVVRVLLGEKVVYDGTMPAAVYLPRAKAVASAPVPAIGAGASVAVPRAAAVAEAHHPAVTAGGSVSPPAATAAGSAPGVHVSAGVSITLPTATATAAAPVPQTQVVNAGELLLPRASATAQALVPTVSVVAVVEPEPAGAVAEALAPTITAGGGVALPPASAAAAAGLPGISSGGSVTLPCAQASAAALTPVISVPAARTLPIASAAASALAPTWSSGITIIDDFNRANASTLGADWSTVGSYPLVLASNRAQAGTPGFNQTLTYISRHNTPLQGDTQEVTVVPIAATVGPDPNLGAGVFLRGTTGGTFVCVSVDANKAYINTFASGVYTQNRATSGTIPTPTLVRFTAVGNVYSVYINGSATPAVTWTDTGGVIGIGAANRSFGVLGIAAYSFSGGTRGWAFDSISARDGLSA